jgi:hypothetical protein
VTAPEVEDGSNAGTLKAENFWQGQRLSQTPTRHHTKAHTRDEALAEVLAVGPFRRVKRAAVEGKRDERVDVDDDEHECRHLHQGRPVPRHGRDDALQDVVVHNHVQQREREEVAVVKNP